MDGASRGEKQRLRLVRGAQLEERLRVMNVCMGVGTDLEQQDATRLLNAAAQGDSRAAERLLPLVYEELRRLAARNMSRESADHTLQPTALVHEAYARLVGGDVAQQWSGRGHFFAAAAKAMRRILIEEARRKQSEKRGGNWTRRDVDVEQLVANPPDDAKLLGLDEALTKLAEEEPQIARLVELRFFAGLGIDEAAQMLQVSPRTAKRHWAYARAWLRRELERLNEV